MTNEEAVEVLKHDIPCEHDNDLIEALNMAIKALKTLKWIKEETEGYYDLANSIAMDTGNVVAAHKASAFGILLKKINKYMEDVTGYTEFSMARRL